MAESWKNHTVPQVGQTVTLLVRTRDATGTVLKVDGHGMSLVKMHRTGMIGCYFPCEFRKVV